MQKKTEKHIKELDINVDESKFNVNYNATLKDYKNIQCSKITFENVENLPDVELFDKINKDRCKAISIFTGKTNRNINDFYIIERILTKITDEKDKDFIRTMSLTDFYEILHGYMKLVAALNYQIFFVEKSYYEGGCDVKEHRRLFCDSSDPQNELYCKSLKTSDNNCAISIFTNSLKVRLHANNLRETLGLELHTFITIEQLDILVDHFKCDICLYTLKDTFEIIKNTSRNDKKIEAFLFENHYWLVIKHSSKKITEFVTNVVNKNITVYIDVNSIR